MLVKLKKEQLLEYVDFAYDLATDFKKSCYPSFADGIKTKDDFIKVARKAFEKENDEIYLFYHNNILEGWIHYYYLKEDNYLSCLSFNIRNYTEIAFKELLAHFYQYFDGYNFYFGCSHKNLDALAVLRECNFKLIEHSCHNVLFFENYTPKEESLHVKQCTKDNFKDFAELHVVNEEMYWNRERILEKLDEWYIYLYYDDNTPIGSIYFIDETLTLEIFGIDYLNGQFDPNIMRDLMITALNRGKLLAAKYLVFFATEEETDVLLSLGFTCIDRYQCYFKKISKDP